MAVNSIVLQNPFGDANDGNIIAGDILGRIGFSAPSESGADALLVAALISAVAEEPFTISANKTKILFSTANGDVATARLAVTGDGHLVPATDDTYDLGTASLQFKDGYFHGTLEADAITLGGTALGALYSVIAGSSSILTVGALDSGSITSGFTSIDVGAGAITTTGAISGGTGSTFSSSSASEPVVTIQNTHSGATSGYLKFVNNKGAVGAADDVCGTITFYGDDVPETNMEFARIEGMVAVATDDNEGGKLKFSVASHDGEMNQGLLLTDGSAEDEIDGTICNGTASVLTVAGKINVANNITMGRSGSSYNLSTLSGVTNPNIRNDNDNRDINIDYSGTGGELKLRTYNSGATTRVTYDASGNATHLGKITTGADTNGFDVKFFGNATGRYMLWDESIDRLIVSGSITQPIETSNEDPEDDVSLNIDLSRGNYYEVELASNISNVIFQKGAVGQRFIVRFQQHATSGPYTLAWTSVTHDLDGGGSPAATTVSWPGGTAPTMTFEDDRADTYGFIVRSEGSFDGYVIGQDIVETTN